MLIDAHTHAFLPEDLEVLGERLALLDAGLDAADPHKWQVHLPGGVEPLLAAEKNCGVERLVLLPVSGSPKRNRELNRWAADQARKHPEVIPFGLLHPQGPYRDELAELVDLGLKGVKLHPMIQRFSLEDEAAQAMLGLIAQAGLPVMLDTMYMEGMYRAKPHVRQIFEMMGYDSCTPEQVAQAARAHPKLKIIAAHGGALYGWERIEPLYGPDNIYLDISYLNGLLPRPNLLAIIRKKGARRVLYGSDAPWREPAGFRQWFDSLELTPEERRLIGSQNLLDLLGQG